MSRHRVDRFDGINFIPPELHPVGLVRIGQVNIHRIAPDPEGTWFKIHFIPGVKCIHQFS